MLLSNKPAALCKVTYMTCITLLMTVNQEYILLAHVDRCVLLIIYCAVIGNQLG